MSFFGITMHGPQNSFQQSLVNAVGIKFFSAEEYQAAFRRIDKDRNGYIDISEVENLLRETYGFDPLPEETDAFMINFDLNHDGRVTWEEFAAGMDKVKIMLNEKAALAARHTSHSDMMFRRTRHVRDDYDPNDSYKAPMTYGQEYGFDKFDRTLPTANRTYYARKMCEESKYADSVATQNIFH